MEYCWDWEEILLVVPVLLFFVAIIFYNIGTGVEMSRRLAKNAHKEYMNGDFLVRQCYKCAKDLKEDALKEENIVVRDKKEINT